MMQCEHTSATVTAAEGQEGQRKRRIVDELKIELENLQRQNKEEAEASAKEISSLRLRVVALETQLGKDPVRAANEPSIETRLGAGNVAGFYSSFFQSHATGVSQSEMVLSPQQETRK